MSKKSIRLEDYVEKIVESKIQKVSAGNFNSYINMLIYNDNKQEIDIKQEALEKLKPIRSSEVKRAVFENSCDLCNKKIRVGSLICNAKFEDGHEKYVHKKCCRI